MTTDLKNEIMDWIKVIVVAVILSFLITRFVKPTIVKGESMLPTLRPNDYLIVNCSAYKNNRDIKYMDIVVFESEIPLKENKKKDLVKRVIGLPGDHIVVDEGKVYRNDTELDQSFTNDGITDRNTDVVVTDGHIFVMGDNRLNSSDSRDSRVGLVDMDKIIGKVCMRLFPFNKITIY